MLFRSDSGNYGSVWTDFDNDGDLDLYIAKCRQGVQDNTDERRINVLFVNNGNGTYSEMGATYGLRIGAQSWTANFADIDNDGDLDCLVTNHDVDSQILENDGSGHYTDITATTGLDLSDITSIESVMEDFDNDGFVDILVTGDDARYFHNNGNKTFTKISNLFDNNAMESFAIGDLNHDGFMDIYASYAGIYTTPDPSVNDMIWLNKGNTNNFVTVDLKGTTSNEGALGARVEIYGAWGKQIREVHAGESYGTCNTSSCHFGLGTATAIDSIVVRWPSGNITHIANPKANQFVKVIESQCVSADNVITSNTNSFTFCSGQSLTLNAPAGHSYLWSDASVGQSISISTTGEYNVTISDALSLCPVTSATVKPSLNPDETPSVVVSGKLSFCQGGSVTLTSSQANSYLWSNGDATQSITVTQPNSYSLTVQGVCQQFTSTPIVVNVLAAPIPTAQGASLVGPGSVTLTAAGNSLSWFTQSLGGTAVGTGTNYVTPYLTSPTTFYVQDAYSYGGGTVSTGQKNHQGTSLYSGTNNFNETILFNVIQPCTLQSVKVYTDTYGGRIIELRNASGTVLQSHSVDISADSTVVPLNFVLTPGTNYQIGTNEAKNMISFGFASPRFQRSASANYPYLADSALTLTSSSQGSNYYYYFYDWKVEKAPTVCESERVPVLADIVLGVSSVANTEGINLFPNPTNDKLYIRSDKSVSSLVSIDITDVSGRVINHIALNTLVANNTETIDVSNIASGVYFVKIKTANSQLVERVVVR